MSEPIPLSELPENIGRNDLCPCGSTKKYKKCCERAHRLQRESEKASNQPHKLIGSKTIAWKVLKVLRQVHANNAVGLFHELTHDASPLRETYPDRGAFMQAVDAGAASLPAAPEFEFLHIRLDTTFTYLLLREADPKKDSVTFQVVTLRRNELDASGAPRDVEHQGYRIWDVTSHTVAREDAEGVSLDALGVQWEEA